VALALRCGSTRRIAAETDAKSEILDVVAESNGQPSPPGPLILRTLVDRDVVITIVGGKFHRRSSIGKPVASRSPSPAQSGGLVGEGSGETSAPLEHGLALLHEGGA